LRKKILYYGFSRSLYYNLSCVTKDLYGIYYLEHGCTNETLYDAVITPDLCIIECKKINEAVDAISQLQTFYSTNPVIVICEEEDPSMVYDLLHLGVRAYLCSPITPQRIVTSITTVLDGGIDISPKAMGYVIQKLITNPTSEPHNMASLSTRQLLVLKMLAKGHSQKMVANEFNITINTVKTLLNRAYKKLEAHSITDAIAKLNLSA
jgi:DNA-binding NarL/FixJ family response regulator